MIDSFHHCYSRIYGFVLPLWRDQIFDRVFELMGAVLILKRALPRFLLLSTPCSLCVSCFFYVFLEYPSYHPLKSLGGFVGFAAFSLSQLVWFDASFCVQIKFNF